MTGLLKHPTRASIIENYSQFLWHTRLVADEYSPDILIIDRMNPKCVIDRIHPELWWDLKYHRIEQIIKLAERSYR